MHTINGLAVFLEVDRSPCGRQCLPVILWPLITSKLKVSIMSADSRSMNGVVTENLNVLNEQD